VKSVEVINSTAFGSTNFFLNVIIDEPINQLLKEMSQTTMKHCINIVLAAMANHKRRLWKS
jgi:hypothetical protein